MHLAEVDSKLKKDDASFCENKLKLTEVTSLIFHLYLRKHFITSKEKEIEYNGKGVVQIESF